MLAITMITIPLNKRTSQTLTTASIPSHHQAKVGCFRVPAITFMMVLKLFFFILENQFFAQIKKNKLQSVQVKYPIYTQNAFKRYYLTYEHPKKRRRTRIIYRPTNVTESIIAFGFLGYVGSRFILFCLFILLCLVQTGRLAKGVTIFQFIYP